MSSDEEDEIPDLVPASEKKVPITIITGFLGKLSSISDLVPASEKKVPIAIFTGFLDMRSSIYM